MDEAREESQNEIERQPIEPVLPSFLPFLSAIRGGNVKTDNDGVMCLTTGK